MATLETERVFLYRLSRYSRITHTGHMTSLLKNLCLLQKLNSEKTSRRKVPGSTQETHDRNPIKGMSSHRGKCPKIKKHELYYQAEETQLYSPYDRPVKYLDKKNIDMRTQTIICKEVGKEWVRSLRRLSLLPGITKFKIQVSVNFLNKLL